MDLETFRFDFDLTFSVLLMNADGTIYHRYGGRDHTSATSALTMPSLVRLLEKALDTHRSYAEAPRPPKITPQTLMDVPAWAKKVAERERAGKPIDCTHCHFVFDARRRQALADGTWSKARIWRWPPPARIGLSLDRDVQERVVAVAPSSPAAAAGLRPGDQLQALDGQRILTHTDVSWVLERTTGQAAALELSVFRDGERRTLHLELPAGWKEGSPLDFSWRPSKWQLEPRPGFGGRDLTAQEKRALGLGEDAFAFRVGYVVTWGTEPRYGREAKRAGIHKGDVVVDVGGADLAHQPHFHAWWRLTRRPGEVVKVTVLRDGERKVLELTVLD